jgi:CBS domain-containing protein
MRVQDVMTNNVKTVASAVPAEDAWNIMRAEGIHHLVVVDGAMVTGLLSARDAGGPRGAWQRRNRTVGDLMVSPVVTVEPSATIRKAANLMRGRSIGCVVVATARRISGIFTVTDLLALLGNGVERPVARTKRHTLSHRVPHRKQAQAPVLW